MSRLYRGTHLVSKRRAWKARRKLLEPTIFSRGKGLKFTKVRFSQYHNTTTRTLFYTFQLARFLSFNGKGFPDYLK